MPLGGRPWLTLERCPRLHFERGPFCHGQIRNVLGIHKIIV
jgi:hypothetical protein